MPMHRLALSATVLLLAVVVPAQGQRTTSADTVLRVAGPSLRPATDSLFRRARRLVAEGNGVAGRALVDSLMRAVESSSSAYGDALYWHGALAPTAAEAERDYRRVIVEYPLAYYADDALLAMAELEQARGDRAGALMHLQRFVKDHPSSPERGVAALGAARLAFEQRDTKLGCTMIAAARASASATDVELRNQIDYHGRPCTGAAATASTPPPAAPGVAPGASTPPPVTPTPVPSTPPLRVNTSTPVTTMPEPVTPPRRAPTRVPTPVPAVRPAPMRRDRVATATATAHPRAGAVRPATMYTIQLAAYDTRPPAEQLVRKLATRGVQARVSGTARPFRVRLDFYRTRLEAANVVASLKARGIIGFVTAEAPSAEARSP